MSLNFNGIDEDENCFFKIPLVKGRKLVQLNKTLVKHSYLRHSIGSVFCTIQFILNILVRTYVGTLRKS